MTRRERALQKVLQEFPILWAINNLWLPSYIPQVVSPTKEFFSEPFPVRASHSGNVSVWVHLTIPDNGPRVYPSPMNRIFCPNFTPHPTESLGKVLYNHYVRKPLDSDDWEGNLETVVVVEGQPMVGDVERLVFGCKIMVFPSRKNCTLSTSLTEWFGEVSPK